MSTSITVVGPLPMRAAGAASSSQRRAAIDLDLNFIFSRTENNRNDLGIRFFRFRDDAMGVAQQTALGAEDWGYSRGISTDDSSDLVGLSVHGTFDFEAGDRLGIYALLNSGSETIPSAGVTGSYLSIKELVPNTIIGSTTSTWRACSGSSTARRPSRKTSSSGRRATRSHGGRTTRERAAAGVRLTRGPSSPISH